MTFRQSNNMFARLAACFGHVCIWRGVLLTLVLLVIGLHAIIGQSTILVPPSRYGFIQLQGTEAMMMGLAWVGAALALHSHFFWSRIEIVWRVAGLGTAIGIVLIAAGWGYAMAQSFGSVFS